MARAWPFRKSAPLEDLNAKKPLQLWAFFISDDFLQGRRNNAMKYMGKTIIKKISHCGKIGNKH
jgi:hypothetical protein